MRDIDNDEEVRGLIDEWSSRPSTRVGGRVGEDAIRDAEQRVGTFPPSYRRFVADYGYLEAPELTILGLGEEVPAHLNMVRETFGERRFEPRLPDGYIAIAPDGNGNVLLSEGSRTGRARRIRGVLPRS